MANITPISQIVTTADGSHSIFAERFEENYHSIHGAIQESEHVFIQAGLADILPNIKADQPLYIFEMGFGTGLNVLLTYLYQKQYFPDQKIHYLTIEAYPIEATLAHKLNYVEQILEKNTYDFEPKEATIFFNQLHDSQWSINNELAHNFTFQKVKSTLESIDLDKDRFGLVYFDAFAPTTQAELWDKSIFEKIYKGMKKEGIMTTYCAKGIVKRTLKAVGFQIEALAGPPKKREMTRAKKV